MYKRAFCWACAALVFFFFACAFLITCSGVEASADDERALTPSECRSIWGDSLSCSYSYSGSDYTGTFSYLGTLSGSAADLRGINIESNSVIGSSSWSDYTVLVYRLHTNLGHVNSIRNLHIAFVMNYDTYIRGCFGIGTWATISNVSQSENFISSYPNNRFANVSALSANSAASADFANYYNVCSASNTDGLQYDYRLLPYEFAGGGVFEDGIYWDSVYSDGSGNVLFLLFTPIVRGNVSSDVPVTTTVPPVTTAPSGSGTDMSETNGLLGRILAAIQGIAQSILDGIKGLFIPDDDFMDGFKDDMSNLLENHLGGLYEAEQIMVDAFGRFPEVAAKSEIYIPPATLNLAGTPFTVGDWHVPLKVQGVPALLYDGIAFIIDFLCLAAFLRMCRNKLEIFLNPDSEVVKE